MPDFIKKQIANKPKASIFSFFLEKYWFVPSDILQRAIEANIWQLCIFKRPILSIGIGNGELDSLLFEKNGLMDVGIDIDNSQLATARKLGIYKKVLAVNAEKMPFKSGEFNSAVSNSTFEHIQNSVKAVSEVSRVLKRGGLFFFTTPSNFLSEWILEYEENRDQKSAPQKIKDFNTRAQHLHYLSLSAWEKTLDNNGFDVVLHKYYFSKSAAVYWYKLFSLYTKKIRGKEILSYLGQSKLSKFVPKEVIKYFLNKGTFYSTYSKEVFVEKEGAQHFFVARKR